MLFDAIEIVNDDTFLGKLLKHKDESDVLSLFIL